VSRVPASWVFPFLVHRNATFGITWELFAFGEGSLVPARCVTHTSSSVHVFSPGYLLGASPVLLGGFKRSNSGFLVLVSLVWRPLAQRSRSSSEQQRRQQRTTECPVFRLCCSLQISDWQQQRFVVVCHHFGWGCRAGISILQAGAGYVVGVGRCNFGLLLFDVGLVHGLWI